MIGHEAKNDAKCPHCGAKPASFFAPGHPETPPSVGDFWVCGKCGSIARFDAALNLTTVREEAWNKAKAEDPEACRQMLIASTLGRVAAAMRRQRIAAIARNN